MKTGVTCTREHSKSINHARTAAGGRAHRTSGMHNNPPLTVIWRVCCYAVRMICTQQIRHIGYMLTKRAPCGFNVCLVGAFEWPLENLCRTTRNNTVLKLLVHACCIQDILLGWMWMWLVSTNLHIFIMALSPQLSWPHINVFLWSCMTVLMVCSMRHKSKRTEI